MSTFFSTILPHSFYNGFRTASFRVALPLLLFLPAPGLNASLQHFSHERPDPYLLFAPLLALSFRTYSSITHPPEQIPLKAFLQSSLIPPTVPPERQADLRQQLSHLANKNREDTNIDQTRDTSKSLTLYSSVISGQYRIVLPHLDRDQLPIAAKIAESVLDHELRLILSVLSLREISTLLYQPPASLTSAAGGGDGDDGDDNERFRENFQPPDFLFFIYPQKQRTALQLTLKDILSSRLQHKLRLLNTLRRKLKYAEDDNLRKIYRDRIMVIQADCDDLESGLRAYSDSDAVSCVPAYYSELNQPLAYYLAHLASVQPILPDELPGGVPKITQQTIKQQNDQPSQNPRNNSNQKPDEHQPDEDEQSDGKNDPPEKGNAPDTHVVEMSYIEKIEAFLDIPEEDFLEIDGRLKFQLFQKSRQSNDTKKGMMAEAVFKWLKNRNREEARELFMQAYTLSLSEADNNFDPDDQVLAWLMIHKYKKLLEGTSEDAEADEQELHSYFHRPVEQANPEVLPLLIMYYTDALPGIHSFLDIELYLALIDKFESCYRNYHRFYFFPVSFTAIDRIRWTHMSDTAYTSLDLTYMSHSLASMINRSVGLSIFSVSFRLVNLFYVLIGLMTEWKEDSVDNNEYLTKLPWRGHNEEALQSIHILRKRLTDKVNLTEKNYNDFIQFYSSLAEKKISITDNEDHFFSVMYYQYCAILEREKNEQYEKKGNIPKYKKYKVLIWYQKAAEYSPELWHRVFQEAQNIGKTDSVIEAARQLHHFWLSRSPLIADYWGERLKSLSHQSSEETESIPETIDEAESTIPDWVLTETSAPDKRELRATHSKKTRKSKKKRPGKAAKATPTDQKHAENYDSNVEKPAKTLSPKNIAALPNATIKVGKRQNNIGDISRTDDQWQVRTSKKTVRPFERIYQENWNEKVDYIIKKAHVLRKTANPNKEYGLYQELLKGTSNSMVGIERIWEEMGWLLLHQYDNTYATRIINDDLKKAALDTAFKAKDKYFLPAIASYLGLDEMNSSLSPEDFYQSVLTTLTHEQFDTISQKVDFVRRLRSLASSVAHSFSLAAMASPRNKKLGSLAQSWYKAKTDLLTQEKILKIIQEKQLE
ncbi:hypothetical protein [Endozoicomonas euniceicola]|uniref:Uncharacterized protein n=1 Tax=Endozoicomonas euniceicola TaxID=1234143 RepID=A0ABY6GV23_9GAMM|nr:hypothetical protein [Endozoicomonas euniceicola]UYM15799.1 hypothetical protein NX720_23735 [Endozoicomonas euniceicola]